MPEEIKVEGTEGGNADEIKNSNDAGNVTLGADGKPVVQAADGTDKPGVTAEEQAAIDAEAAELAEKEAADKAAKEAEEAEKAANLEAYGDLTGNPAMDDVAEFLKEANAPADAVKALFEEAHATRDLSKIDVAKLEELVGEPKARMIMSRLNEGVTALDAEHKATLSMLHEAAGGEDTFSKAAEWLKASTDPTVVAEREELRATINAGGLSAKLATQHLVAAYKSSGSYTKAADLIEGEASQTDFAGYISQSDYIKEIHKGLNPTQQDALDARRMRSIAMERKR